MFGPGGRAAGAGAQLRPTLALPGPAALNVAVISLRRRGPAGHPPAAGLAGSRLPVMVFDRL